MKWWVLAGLAIIVVCGNIWLAREPLYHQFQLATSSPAEIAKGQACADMGGNIPALVDAVRQQAADPASVAPIETSATPTEGAAVGLLMRFRARNAMGGMQFFQAIASLKPGDCSVQLVMINPE